MSVSMNIRASFLAVTMLAGLGVLSVPAIAADAAGADHVSAVLSDARMQAFQLKEDASLLESYTRSKVNWESHATTISRFRDNINKMSGLLTQMQDARSGAAPWQQAAIDRIVPVAKELASNTTTAIEALNRNPRQLSTPAYEEYLEAINDSASNLAATIADFTDYGKTRERLDRLAKKLEIPASAQ